MFFQLMLYDFVTTMTLKKFIRYLICLLLFSYYTAYTLIERRHPGIHKAQFAVIQRKYTAILQPYEPAFLLGCMAALALFIFYMAYCYWNNKKKNAQLRTQDNEPPQELAKDNELLFLKEHIQLIQQRIEAIERG